MMNFNFNFNFMRRTASNKQNVNSNNNLSPNSVLVDSNNTTNYNNAFTSTEPLPNIATTNTPLSLHSVVLPNNNTTNNNINNNNNNNKSVSSTAIASATKTTLVPILAQQSSSSSTVTFPPSQASNNNNNNNSNQNLNHQFVLPPVKNTTNTNNMTSSNGANSSPNFFSLNKSNLNNAKSNDNIRNTLNDVKAILDSESQLKLEIESPPPNPMCTISRPPILTPINNNNLKSLNSASDNLVTKNRRNNLKPFDFNCLNSTPTSSSNLPNNNTTTNSSSSLSSSNKGSRFHLDFNLGATGDDPVINHQNHNHSFQHHLSLNLQPNSSSRSSSASSQQSHSLSSSSSSLVTGSGGAMSNNHSVGRLEAVNSDKYREIMKNKGYLLIDNKRIKTNMEDLSQIDELGNGTCGHVVKMKHNLSDNLIAVKKMRISGVAEENRRIIMDLDVVLKCHDCPFIVKCLGYFISESDVWICMELMAMCFDKLLKLIKGPIPEPILGKLVVSTVTALSYLKEHHNVIHRDVKPSNILIDENGNIKLCDFGISGNLINSHISSRNAAGCAGYMAPERIDPSNPVYDTRADIWSLGVTLVELSTGEYPYKKCQTEFEVMTTILSEEAPVLRGDQFSENFKSFVNQCLIKDVKQRPKYNVLLKHPFVEHYRNNAVVDVKSWFKSVLETNNK